MPLIHVFDGDAAPGSPAPGPGGAIHIRLGEPGTVSAAALPFPVYTVPSGTGSTEPVAFTRGGVLGGSLCRDGGRTPVFFWPIALAPDSPPLRVLAIPGVYSPAETEGSAAEGRHVTDQQIQDALFGMPAADVVVSTADLRDCMPLREFCMRQRVPLVMHSGDGVPAHDGVVQWIPVQPGGEVSVTLRL